MKKIEKIDRNKIKEMLCGKFMMVLKDARWDNEEIILKLIMMVINKQDEIIDKLNKEE